MQSTAYFVLQDICSLHSRLLSLNDRDFVFHLRAFCVRHSAVFGLGGMSWMHMSVTFT
jgi:hypothetical protein